MKKDKLIISLTFILAFIYLSLIGLQGFDFTDEGFCLVFYQQIFENPNSVQINFLYYLTGIVGGVWHSILPWGGIFSFRMLNAVVILVTAYFTYKTVQAQINPLIFSISMTIVILLANFGNLVFHHNYFTALLVSICVIFLTSGILKFNKMSIFIAGLLLGFTFFARIVNISLLSLTILFVINFFYDKDWNFFLQSILIFIVGSSSGILIVFLMMFFTDHLNIFIESLSVNVFYAIEDPDSNYGVNNLLSIYFWQYFSILKFLIIYSILFIGFSFSFRYFKNKGIRIILTLFILVLFLKQQYLMAMPQFYAFVLIPIILSFFFDYKNKSMILLNTAGVLIMFSLPLGSDFGIYTMGITSLWLSTCIAIGHYYRFIKKRLEEKDYSAFIFLSMTIIAFSLLSIKDIYDSKVFGIESRMDKTYSMRNPLANVFTTKDKSEIIDELLLELSKYVEPKDTLLCFESLPTINYLTQTTPFASSSWVWTYEPSIFANYILKAEMSGESMPVVLRQKTQPIGGNWTTYDPRYNDVIMEDNYIYKKDRIIVLNQFLERNKYVISWENELFQILTIPSE